MTRQRYTIERIAWDADADALIVTVDSAHHDRAWRLAWAPHVDDQSPMAVLAHWSSDCVEVTHDLNPAIAWELERLLDADDDVAEALAERVGTKRRAG